MRNKTMVNNIAVLAIAIVVVNLNTASAVNPSEIIDDVANFFFGEFDFANYVSVIGGAGQVNYQNQKPALVIEKLPGVARITTGICLLNGISNGTIPVDKAISELLNLGSMDLKTLVNFNQNSVKSFIDKLGKAQKSLSDGSTDLEQALINMDFIRESWKNVGDLKTLPSSLDPLKAAGAWKTDSFKGFQVVKTMGLLEAETLDYAEIKTNLLILAKAYQEAPGSEATAPVLEVLRSLKPFCSFADVMEQANAGYHGVLRGYSKSAKYLDSNIKILESLSSGPPEIKLLMSVVKSRLAPNHFDKKFISGFIEGSQDLGKMLSDSSDPWILGALRPASSLNGLRSFDPLRIEMGKLEKKWDSFSDENYKALKHVTQIEAQLSTIQKEQEISQLVKQITQTCPLAINQKTAKDMRAISNYFEKLRRNTMALSTIKSSITKEHIDIINGFSDKTNLESINKIAQLLQSIGPSAQVLEQGESLEDTGKLMEFHESYVTEMDQDQIITDYITHLDCVAKVQGDFEKIAATAKLIADLREFKDQESKAIEQVSTEVSESTSLVKALQKLGNTLKGQKQEDLKKLESLRKYSKSFGTAVTVSMMMTRASELKPILRELIAKGHTVEEIQKVPNDFRRKWGDFQGTLLQISKFLDGLTLWEQNTGSLKSTNLVPIGPPIAELAKLVDVDLSVENRLEALDQLISTTSDANSKTKLVEIRGNFEKLRNLDLKFSSHKTALIGFPSTLGKISEIFLLGGDKDSMEGANIPDNDTVTPTIITLSVIAFLICLVTAIWCYCDYKCLFWKLKNHLSKGKASMKTAREGKGGVKVKVSETRVTIDGREDRRPKNSAESLLPPPPPPPPQPTENGVKAPVASSTAGSSSNSSGGSSTVPQPPPSTQNKNKKTSAQNTVPKKEDPPKKAKPEAAAKAPPEPALKNPAKKASKTNNNTKTVPEESKSKDTSTDGEPETPEPPPKNKKNNAKNDDTLCQPDSTDKSHKTTETEKFTKDYKTGEDVDDAAAFDNNKTPISDGSKEPPPLPHQKIKKAKK